MNVESCWHWYEFDSASFGYVVFVCRDCGEVKQEYEDATP